MELLTPDWQQPRPKIVDVQAMCRRIQLTPESVQMPSLGNFIEQVRKSHTNGGAYLVVFDVGADPVFDWFASRNRLADDDLLDQLLLHPAVRQALPNLFLPVPKRIESGLAMYDQFLLDGTLSRILYNGGAYSIGQGDGRPEKRFALDVCEAMFGLRFGEVSCYLSDKAWSSWFKGIAWDITVVLFDCRTRQLWVLVITDTD